MFWNPRSGWAEATAAVKKTIEVAIDQGVEYVEGTVSTLLFDRSGNCTGVQVGGGRQLTADYVILRTGSQTAKLIADSAPQRKSFKSMEGWWRLQ